MFYAFKAESSGNDVLHYYYMHRQYPELMLQDPSKNPICLMSRFSEEREKVKYIEAAIPTMSGKYALKNLAAMMGQDFKTDTVQDLEAQTDT